MLACLCAVDAAAHLWPLDALRPDRRVADVGHHPASAVPARLYGSDLHPGFCSRRLLGPGWVSGRSMHGGWLRDAPRLLARRPLDTTCVCRSGQQHGPDACVRRAGPPGGLPCPLQHPGVQQCPCRQQGPLVASTCVYRVTETTSVRQTAPARTAPCTQCLATPSRGPCCAAAQHVSSGSTLQC